MKKQIQKQTIMGAMALLFMGAAVVPHAQASPLEQFTSNYSVEAPVFNVTISNLSDWVNSNLTLNVSVVSPDGSGISHIVQPNGNVVSTTSFLYTVSENGMYSFKAYDRNGKVGFYTIHVNNIDKKKPTVNLTVPTEWTKQDPRIDIQVVND